MNIQKNRDALHQWVIKSDEVSPSAKDLLLSILSSDDLKKMSIEKQTVRDEWLVSIKQLLVDGYQEQPTEDKPSALLPSECFGNIDTNIGCTMEIGNGDLGVWGCDGEQYSNECVALTNGILRTYSQEADVPTPLPVKPDVLSGPVDGI